MAMALKAVHEPPPQRTTALVCMMDPRCAQSFTKSVQLQSSISNHFQLMFALKILCVLFLNMAMALSAEHAQPQRIIEYECMNPRCAHSFSNMHSYDVPRYHERNVGTLCASLTMRREIVATRRPGLTTTVIKQIPSKGKQCACIHIRVVPMTTELF